MSRSDTKPFYTLYVGVGSNVGDRAWHIETAAQELATVPGVESLVAATTIETPPWGNTDQGPFLNTVFAVTTQLSPSELLTAMQQIERAHGRERKIHWGPRTLDLDILLGWTQDGDWVTVDTEALQVPHPYFWERSFVLTPLAELLPTFTYQGQSIIERIQILDSEA